MGLVARLVWDIDEADKDIMSLHTGCEKFVHPFSCGEIGAGTGSAVKETTDGTNEGGRCDGVVVMGETENGHASRARDDKEYNTV